MLSFPMLSWPMLSWPMLSFSMASPTAQMLVAILHVALAAAVTIDVLLKKNDVRAALAWIGMVWFTPILGSLLYYLFGINRVTRRASKMGRLDGAPVHAPDSARPDTAPNIALLAQAGHRINQAPLTGGNALRILEDGDAAYPHMLAAIAGAKHS